MRMRKGSYCVERALNAFGAQRDHGMNAMNLNLAAGRSLC